MENGAQVIQYFESWAHHLAPHQFETFAKPYANKAMAILKSKHPDVPIIYFANGGSSYLETQVLELTSTFLGREFYNSLKP